MHLHSRGHRTEERLDRRERRVRPISAHVATPGDMCARHSAARRNRARTGQDETILSRGSRASAPAPAAGATPTIGDGHRATAVMPLRATAASTSVIGPTPAPWMNRYTARSTTPPPGHPRGRPRIGVVPQPEWREHEPQCGGGRSLRNHRPEGARPGRVRQAPAIKSSYCSAGSWMYRAPS